jgi:hypothetical protein
VLRVFESRLLRRIFGLQREEIKGGSRKSCNEELHNCGLFTMYEYYKA